MEKEFTHKQKLAYYKKRAKDDSLTLPQRRFAQGFVDGADDAVRAYTYKMPNNNKTLNFLKAEIPVREKANKEFVSATYNGYGQGTVSALKDIVAKRERKQNDG